MKLNTNVFFFAALMMVSFAARAEGETNESAKPGLLDQASALVTAAVNGTVDAAKAGFNGALDLGQQGVDLAASSANTVVDYAKDGVVLAGKGVSSVGSTIQEYPGYTAAAVAAVAAGYVVYVNYFADCKDCKKAKKASN